MKRPIRWTLIALTGLIGLIALLVLFVASPPGTRFVARRVLDVVNDQLTGSVQVARISGSILRRLIVEDVTVADENGERVATVQRVEVQYNPLAFLGSRYVLGPIVVDSPAVWITRRSPDAPVNVSTLAPSSNGSTGPSASLIAFENVTITGGAADVRLPSHPPRGSDTDGGGESYVVRGVDASLRRLQLASPGMERDIELIVERLAAQVLEPYQAPVGLAGTVEVLNDSVAVDLSSISVGRAAATAGGWARLSTDPVEFSGRLDAQRIDSDVVRRFVSSLPEEFAGLSGDARVQVRSLPSGGYHVVGDTIAVRSSRGEMVAGRVEGEWVDRHRWDVDTASITWANIDLDRLRAFLDTVPIRGTMAGSVSLAGTPESVQLAMRASVRDERGRTPASVNAAGGLSWLRDTIAFRSMAVRPLQIDLASARAFAPELDVPGRGIVTATATLDGTPRDLRIWGTLRHSGPDTPASNVRGRARVTTRASRPLALQTDLTIDSIFPAAFLDDRWSLDPVRGTLSAAGVLDSLDVDADLTNAGGRLDATGTIVARGAGAISVNGRISAVDVSTFYSTAPQTDLAGDIAGAVRGWRGDRPVGEVTLHLDSSSVGGTRFRSVYAALAATDDVLRVDSLILRAPAFTALGAGRIGRDDRTSGTMSMEIHADSLQYFDWLADWLAGPTDSAEATSLSGRAAGSVELRGNLERFDATGSVTADQLMHGNLASRALAAEFAWTSGDSAVTLIASVDSLSVSGFVVDTVAARVGGTLSSISWDALARRDTVSVAAAGRASVADSLIEVTADSLAVALPTSAWRATSPLRVAIRGTTVDADSVVIARVGRTGRITIAGHYEPGDSLRVLAVVDSFPVGDLVGMLPNPPPGVGGFLLADLDARGTPSDPTIDMTFEVVAPTVENVSIPRVTGSAAYANRILTGELTLVREGARILQANAELPVDLGFPGPPDRRLDGPVTITGQLDSIHLNVLDAFLPALDESDGSLWGSISVTGNWFDPEMRGSVTLRDGAATLPALGISVQGLQSELQLVRDTIRVAQLRATSGPGTVDVSGSVWLQELSRPILQLAVRTDRFQAMDDPEYLSLVTSGEIQMRGPVFGATLTGELETPNAALHFDRFIDNQMIDLSDSLYASFVDTMVLAEEDIRPEFQATFLDSLTIADLGVTMGSDVWLRSEDVNVQLTGSLRVNKTGDSYTATGVLSAVRGTYVLRLGPAISREFRVLRGEVRYLGTADLNATLDIDAEHAVRTFRGENVRVQAHIGGTVQEPEVTLSSDLATNVSDTEIISYLLFGASSVQAFAGRGGRDDRTVFQQGAERLIGGLAGQLETGLTSGLGIPLDYLKITPGSLESGLSGTEIRVGKQLDLFGRSSFLTASPRLCLQDQLSLDKIGASIETWLSNHWLVVASVDPLKGCETPAPGTTAYQLGADVFWETR